MNKILKQNLIIFSIFLCLFGGIMIFAPTLPDWDFYNYRWYNCWAILNDRIFTDFFAANQRTCFNTLLDLPMFLWLNKMNFHPIIFLFTGALSHALCFFFLYKIFDYVFLPQKEKFTKPLAVWFSVFFVIFATPMFRQLNFEQNDIKITMLIVFGLYVFLRTIFLQSSTKRNILLCFCSILFSLAFIKFSAFAYVISVPLLIIILYKKIDRPWFVLANTCITMLLCFAIFHGFWLYKCFLRYESPVFPYLNQIFHSPFADNIDLISYDMSNSLPQNLKEFIFYPFLYSQNFCYSSPEMCFDIRFAISFFVNLIIIPATIISFSKASKSNNNSFLGLITYENLFIILWMIIVPSLINLKIFAIARYSITSLLLQGVPLFILIYAISDKISAKINRSKTQIATIFCIFFVFSAYFFSNNGYFESLKASEVFNIKKMIDCENLDFKDNSTVIFAGSASSAIAPFQNSNVQYFSLHYPQKMFDDYIKTNLSKYGNDLYACATYTPSEFLTKYSEDLILSDKYLSVIFIEDEYYDLQHEALNYFNSKRQTPRKLTDCHNFEFTVMGKQHAGLEKCDFNP